MSFTENGNLTPGKEEFSAVFQGKLYMFAGDGELTQFLSNPSHFVDKFHTLRNAGNGGIVFPPPKFFLFGHSGAITVRSPLCTIVWLSFCGCGLCELVCVCVSVSVCACMCAGLSK